MRPRLILLHSKSGLSFSDAVRNYSPHNEPIFVKSQIDVKRTDAKYLHSALLFFNSCVVAVLIKQRLGQQHPHFIYRGPSSSYLRSLIGPNDRATKLAPAQQRWNNARNSRDGRFLYARGLLSRPHFTAFYLAPDIASHRYQAAYADPAARCGAFSITGSRSSAMNARSASRATSVEP